MTPPWAETEIIPGLFVGDLQDATKFDGMIISVLADVPPNPLEIHRLASRRIRARVARSVLGAPRRLNAAGGVVCRGFAVDPAE